jgi:hypothetical protein
MKASANKFRAEADFADQIVRSATDPEGRSGLAAHFRQLADAIVAKRTGSGSLTCGTRNCELGHSGILRVELELAAD